MPHRLIGEILTEHCSLPADVLTAALTAQEEKGGRIGEILIDRQAVSEADVLKG